MSTDDIHKYTSADKFTVKAVIYDDQDNTNTIEKKIFISGGKQPIAKIKVMVNGEESHGYRRRNDSSVKRHCYFDAVDSKMDGTDKTSKQLNFGTKNSSKKKATHTYKIKSKNTGYYES